MAWGTGRKYSDGQKEKIYRDRTNGTIEHFVYAEGKRVFVSRAWAENEVGRGRAKYIDLWEVKKNPRKHKAIIERALARAKKQPLAARKRRVIAFAKSLGLKVKG